MTAPLLILTSICDACDAARVLFAFNGTIMKKYEKKPNDRTVWAQMQIAVSCFIKGLLANRKLLVFVIVRGGVVFAGSVSCGIVYLSGSKASQRWILQVGSPIEALSPG